MPSALVADNDPGVRALLGDLVRRSGFEVRVVADGSSARTQVEAGGIDLLVCDLDMPGLSGQQLLAWIAAQPQLPAVVVVSGYVDGAVERELAGYPFVRAVLRKPFDVFGFVQRVREIGREFARPQPAAEGPTTVHARPGEDRNAPAATRGMGNRGDGSGLPGAAGTEPEARAEESDRPPAEPEAASDL